MGGDAHISQALAHQKVKVEHLRRVFFCEYERENVQKKNYLVVTSHIYVFLPPSSLHPSIQLERYCGP